LKEAVRKLMNGNQELLSRLQDLPYLKKEYRISEVAFHGDDVIISSTPTSSNVATASSTTRAFERQIDNPQTQETLNCLTQVNQGVQQIQTQLFNLALNLNRQN